jgi:hypothetical protein
MGSPMFVLDISVKLTCVRFKSTLKKCPLEVENLNKELYTLKAIFIDNK